MWTLVIFTRWPSAGRTKTRLIPEFGAEGAAHIHRQLIARTLAASRMLATTAQVVIAMADAPSHVDPSSLIGVDRPCFEQHGQNLGERMANAIDDTFRQYPSSEATVLIGVDCPNYSSDLFTRAATSLASHAVVFAPTEDGGYGLVGIRRDAWNAELRHVMFEQIQWGTSRVMSESIERLRRVNLIVGGATPQVAMLETIWDIDTPIDAYRAIRSGAISI
jgi:uncharacterized protein